MNLTELYNLARKNGWDSLKSHPDYTVSYDGYREAILVFDENKDYHRINLTYIIFDTNFIKCLLSGFDVSKLPLMSSIYSDLLNNQPDLYLIIYLGKIQSSEKRLDLLLKIFK